MKKKVISILLCISSYSFAMYKPLTTFQPDLMLKSACHRNKTTELSLNKNQYISLLLDYVKYNAVSSLRNWLKDKAEGAVCGSGMMIVIPKVLPQLLRHQSIAPVLHDAVKRCRNQCVELLLAYNTHPNITIVGGDTPLHVARNSSMVRLLIDYGAWVEQKNVSGETPFFKSIKNVDLDMAQILCVAGADVNACNKDNNTPLHYAAKYLGKEAIQFLLYRGACIDCKNKLGQTTYQIICKRGGEVLKTFREWEKVIRAITVTIKSLSIMSLLDHNCKQLKKLLIRDSSDYCSPDIVIAEQLFKRCDEKIWDELKAVYSAEVLSLVEFVKSRSEYRKYFLDALRNDDFFSTHQLLKDNPYLLHAYEGEYQKDEVNNIFVDKVIFSCAHNDQYHYLQKMMYSGFFDIDSCDKLGNPVLSTVIKQFNGCDKYLDLLKAGARVNVQDRYGNTPLLYAVMLENKDMVLQLLSYGAVVNEKFGESCEISYAMWELMDDAYGKQKCCKCETHDYDLLSIPCVNRHLRHFICTNCYAKYPQKCPLCRRSLGLFGC